MATSIKKTVFIAATPPATKDLASYQGATWVQIKGVVSIGSIGFPHATIEVPELESGLTKTYKGARTGSGAEIPFRTIDSDPGQTAVATANESEGEISLKIVSPDGTKAEFWTGILHSLTATEASDSSYEGSTVTFVPNYAVIKGAPTA